MIGCPWSTGHGRIQRESVYFEKSNPRSPHGLLETMRVLSGWQLEAAETEERQWRAGTDRVIYPA